MARAEVQNGQGHLRLEHKKAAPFPKLLRDNHIALLSI